MKTSNSFLQRKKAAIARNGSCYWTYTRTFNLSFCKFNFTIKQQVRSLNLSIFIIKNELHQKAIDSYEILPVILINNGGDFARVDDIEVDVLTSSVTQIVPIRRG